MTRSVCCTAMTRRRLTNEAWGFDSNCFVCEPRNVTGLRIPFFHDDETGSVLAEFALDDSFSGAPSYVHGGVTLAVLDEAQAWATIATCGKFAVTTETTTRFHRPVQVGRTFSVEASVTGQPEGQILTRAEVRNQSGKVCAETTAVFAVLSEAAAVDAIAADLDTIGREHLRD